MCRLRTQTHPRLAAFERIIRQTQTRAAAPPYLPNAPYSRAVNAAGLNTGLWAAARAAVL